jgi:hypothetical protein
MKANEKRTMLWVEPFFGGNSRETSYNYGPGAAVPGSGDDGSISTNTAGRVRDYTGGTISGLHYTAFPTNEFGYLRIDAQTPEETSWDNPANLVFHRHEPGPAQIDRSPGRHPHNLRLHQ